MAKSDWNNPSSIALIWPEHLRAGRAKKLKSFYTEFIKLLQKEDVPLKILFSTSNGLFDPPAFLGDNQIESFDIIADIWLRDYAPIPVSSAKGINYARFKYQPVYLDSKTDKEFAKIDDGIGNELAKRMSSIEPKRITVKGRPLNLDGGNFMHNGLGTAIVTNRIISDNEHLFIDDIRVAFRQQLGIKDLHIIPSEPGDDTGHADGLIRFIGPNDLIISEYPYDWEENRGYIPKEDYQQSRDCVESIVEYFLKKPFIIHRMPNGVPLDSKNFESAVGNYTNFLRVGEKVFLPYYGSENHYKRAADAFVETGIEESNIIKAPDCTTLAKEGGVLNCITAHIY